MKASSLTRLIFSMGAAALLLTSPLFGASPFDSLTWNDGTNDVTSTSSALQTVDTDSTLVSFTVGANTYTQFTGITSLIDNTDPSTDYYYGENGTDPGSLTAALTDTRIDTGALNVISDTRYVFASAPTSLDDVIVFMEFGGTDNSDFELFDSSGAQVGSRVNGYSNWSPAVARIDTNTNDPLNINTVAFTLADFGITQTSQLSSIHSLSTSVSGHDPIWVGIAAIPEPGTLVLAGIALACLVVFRRRR